MSIQPNIKFIPLSFISSEQELKRQIANTIVFSYLTNIYPQTNLNSYLVGTQYGFTASSAESGTHQLVRITDINDGSVDWKTVPYCDCNSENNYLLKEDDILVARTGGTTGKSFLVKSPPNNAVFASYLIRLRTKKEVNIEFIHAFLNSYLYWSQISEMKSGSAQPNVNAEKLKTLLLPNCSFEVQNQIVELLKGGDFSEYPIVKQRLDNTLGNLERFKETEKESKTQAKLLTKLRKAYLQEAVMGQLTADWREQNPTQDTGKALLTQIKAHEAQLIKEGKLRKEKPLNLIKPEEIPFDIPDNWTWCRLGEVTNYGTSEKAEPTDLDESTWVLDLEDIEKESSKLLQKIRFQERKSQSTKSRFKTGDVLYSKLRPYLDKVIVADESGVCTTEILPLRCFGNLNPDFLKITLKSSSFLIYVSNQVKGMKMPRLETGAGQSALIPLPPLTEQQAIVSKIEGLLAQAEGLEKENKAQQEYAQRLMGAVLQEAFGGSKCININNNGNKA